MNFKCFTYVDVVNNCSMELSMMTTLMICALFTFQELDQCKDI
jgi:hypothetical protein